MFKTNFNPVGGGYIAFQSSEDWTKHEYYRKKDHDYNAKESIVFMFKAHLPHAQEILQSHSPSQVTLTNQLFQSWGWGGVGVGELWGVHLQVDLQILTPFLK